MYMNVKTASLGYLGGKLGNGNSRELSDGVSFKAFTAIGEDVPVFVKVSVELQWAKTQLKKTEATIGRYA
jgi:hypothetical protein